MSDDTARDLFSGAKWIMSAAAAAAAAAATATATADVAADGPLPIFRKAFTIDRVPDAATIAICGLGQFELQVNGQKVGGDAMEPAWSNYRKTCWYVVHDVARHLRRGENDIRVMLGNGMYNVKGGQKRYTKFKGSFGRPKLIAAAQVGGRRLVTDASWTVAAGPITFSCIYGGEDFDARLDQPTAWTAAVETEGPGGALREQDFPPVRVARAFEPIKVTEPRPGVRVYDLGQNFSGRPELTVRGRAGAAVKLITGELLDDAGLVTQKNSGSPAWFAYTARGDGEEIWHPRFSYTGFRYVQAEGDVEAIARVKGQFIHTANRVVGQFTCSNELLNRIHDLILAAVRSNMQSVMTDCPHREKLGWLEQAHLMAPSILANFDCAKWYAKICRDMREAQHDNGCVPTIAPQYTVFPGQWNVFNDSPEWGSAMVLAPWHVYRQYGDRAILEDNYGAMRRYVEYLGSRETADGLIDYGLGDWYDIGPGDPGFAKLTSKSLTATAVYYANVVVLRATAALLGRGDDATAYAGPADKIKATFNQKLLDAGTHTYDRGSQTACAMPLVLGLVPAEHRDAVLEQLIRDIRSRENHVTAGDIGFHYVITALATAGRSDVIFDLLSRTDPPSYGAQLARGATALAEAWDAHPKFSQNHLMLGHAEAWFHQWLAGIQLDMTQPAGGQLVLRPTPVGDVTWVKASHDSVLGPVAIEWQRKGDRFTLHATVPVDGVAAHLPDGSARKLSKGSTTIESSIASRS
jgi:hypothetical protein